MHTVEEQFPLRRSSREVLDLLADRGFIERASVLRDRMHEVVLSERKGFQNVFLESLTFPKG